jgi:hypothetical protein
MGPAGMPAPTTDTENDMTATECTTSATALKIRAAAERAAAECEGDTVAEFKLAATRREVWSTAQDSFGEIDNAAARVADALANVSGLCLMSERELSIHTARVSRARDNAEWRLQELRDHLRCARPSRWDVTQCAQTIHEIEVGMVALEDVAFAAIEAAC